MHGFDGITLLQLLAIVFAIYGLARHARRGAVTRAEGKAHEQAVKATPKEWPVVPKMAVRPLRPLRMAEPAETPVPKATPVASYETWHASAECDPALLGFRGYFRTDDMDVTRSTPLVAERLRAIKRGEWPGEQADGGNSGK